MSQFTAEELDAMYRAIQTVHKTEKAIELLIDQSIAPSSKMEVLQLEARIQEEARKLQEAKKAEAATEKPAKE